MSIGERILELRKEQHISQGELAKLLEVSRQAVSKWETDQSCPDTLKLIKLSELLNTDVEYLATGRVRETPSTPIQTSEPKPAVIQPPAPIVVNLVKKVDTVHERVIEKPVIKRVVRIRYRTNPYVILLFSLAAFAIGLFLGVFL